MNNQIINEFTQYSMSDMEILQGQILSQSQLQVIQNLRAQYSVDKLNLKVNPNNYSEFIQEEAALAGSIVALSFILDCHQAAIATAMEMQGDTQNAEVGSKPYTTLNTDTSNIFK